ncbi:MAG: hypothetical protein ACTS4U_01445, partial [Candidatus Hodgkinia cicadicola]
MIPSQRSTELTSKATHVNVNYYPICNINKLVNYLQDFISIAKLHGWSGVLSKVRRDLSGQITLIPWAIGLPEDQATAIIKSVTAEAKELFIVSSQEIANMLLVLICTTLDTFERYRKPLSLIKTKTGWAPPYNLLRQLASKVQNDFIQNQNPLVTMLYNASRIISFWMKYTQTLVGIESIWFSIFKLLSGALTSKLYQRLNESKIHQS